MRRLGEMRDLLQLETEVALKDAERKALREKIETRDREEE
jgi:hypothetical protein